MMAMYWEWTRKDLQRQHCAGDRGDKEEEEDQKQPSKEYSDQKEEW